MLNVMGLIQFSIFDKLNNGLGFSYLAKPESCCEERL